MTIEKKTQEGKCLIKVDSTRRVTEIAPEESVPVENRSNYQFYTTLGSGAVIGQAGGLFPLQVSKERTIHTCNLKGNRISEFREDWENTYQLIKDLVVEPYDP